MGGVFPQVGHTTVRVDASTAITQRPQLREIGFGRFN
jgi:hypothetical protein